MFPNNYNVCQAGNKNRYIPSKKEFYILQLDTTELGDYSYKL